MQNLHTPPPARFATRPLYLQVRDVLAARIASQEWKPSMALPNEGDLAREFGVSSGTMRKALDLLETERLLTRRQGRGTYVNDQASNDLSSRFTKIWGLKGEHVTGDVSLVHIEEADANEAECFRLRLKPSDRVHRVQRLRAYKDEPFLMENITLPAELFPGLSERKNTPPRIVALAQEFGILLGKCEERVYVGTAAADVAQHLRLAQDAPVLVLDRVIFDLESRPVEWRLGRGNFVGKYYLAEFA
jgi:GntR family transcriptional regulator